jgi:hypothetical protein
LPPVCRINQFFEYRHIAEAKIEVSESRLTVTVPATGYRVLELY